MKKKEICGELTSKGSAGGTLLLQQNANHTASDMEREATGEIILYQPDETLSLQVKLDAAHDTVWLNRQQMAELFGRDVKTIGKHVNNALKEELASEQQSNPTVAFFATVQLEGKRKVERQVEYYNLDVILSVGYRVKSNRGILFRRWATRVLKEYLLKGYSINNQIFALQQQIDIRFDEYALKINKLENIQKEQQEQLDFLIKTHTTPNEQLFPNGCVWDAYSYVSSLIRSAKEQVILIDNYVDETVLTLLDKRADGVKAVIHSRFSEGFLRELERHNAQYPPVEFVQFPHKVHDRFLIIDSQVYLLGNSLKDMGHTLSAAILTGFTEDEVLEKLN